MEDHIDEHDGGLYMKQDSVISFCEPTPPSPSTLNGSKSASPPAALTVNNNGVELKRNVSYGNMENTTEARVLVLYTGTYHIINSFSIY